MEQPALALDDDQLGACAGDVRAHPDQAAHQVEDVRLTGGVGDHGDAVGEDGGHDQVLGARDGRHVEVDASAVQPPGVGGVHVGALLHLGAHQAQPLEVLLDTAHADVVTAGLGDGGLTGAGDERPEQEE